MATAKETIQQVQQCTTLPQLRVLEQQELALPKARATVLDALDQREAELKAGPAKPGQGATPPNAQPPAPPTAPPAALFKCMQGVVVVGRRTYTKHEALASPEVMAALVKHRARSLKGN